MKHPFFGDISNAREETTEKETNRMSRYTNLAREIREKNRGISDSQANEIPEKEQKVDDKLSVEVIHRPYFNTKGFEKPVKAREVIEKQKSK